MFKKIKIKLKTMIFIQNAERKIKIFFTFACFSKIFVSFVWFLFNLAFLRFLKQNQNLMKLVKITCF